MLHHQISACAVCALHGSSPFELGNGRPVHLIAPGGKSSRRGWAIKFSSFFFFFCLAKKCWLLQHFWKASRDFLLASRRDQLTEERRGAGISHCFPVTLTHGCTEEKDRSILGIPRHVLHIINTHTQACIKDGAIHKIKSLQIDKDASIPAWKFVGGRRASDYCYAFWDSSPIRPHWLTPGSPVPGALRQMRRHVFFHPFFFSCPERCHLKSCCFAEISCGSLPSHSFPL